MSEIYTCGHYAVKDTDGNYLNGSYATWEEVYTDFDGPQIGFCYGGLCNECIPIYHATKCKLGGEPL